MLGDAQRAFAAFQFCAVLNILSVFPASLQIWLRRGPMHGLYAIACKRQTAAVAGVVGLTHLSTALIRFLLYLWTHVRAIDWSITWSAQFCPLGSHILLLYGIRPRLQLILLGFWACARI